MSVHHPMFGIMAIVAQHEREAIANERGTVLGGYRGGPVICSAEGGEATKQAADAFAALVGPTVRQSWIGAVRMTASPRSPPA